MTSAAAKAPIARPDDETLDAESDGAPYAAATARAQMQTRALTEDYLSWLTASVAKLELLVDDMARAAPDIDAFAAQAREILHDMKGNGATFGFDLVTAIGRSGCDLIGRRTKIDIGCLDALRTHVKALRLIVDQRIVGSGGEPGRRLMERLSAGDQAPASFSPRREDSSGASSRCTHSAVAASTLNPAADDKSQELARAYLAWSETALCQLQQIISADGALRRGDAGAVEEAHGILHDLVGSSAHFDYALMTQIAESACALLSECPGIDEKRRQALHRHVEAMQLVIAKRIAGAGGESGRRLLARLAALSEACRRV